MRSRREPVIVVTIPTATAQGPALLEAELTLVVYSDR
jgi:hypothetical protein